MKKLNNNQRKALIIFILTVVNITLFQFELGRQILYPFTILGTWFHEMSHGLMAIIMGGTFEKLEIFSDGSGVATHSGELYLGGVGRALIAFAGPLGPTLFGFIFIVIAKNEKYTNYGLWLITVIMIVSLILWVRNIFGLVVIGSFATILIFILLKSKNTLHKEFITLFLGLQAIISVYLSLGYIFTKEIVLGNQLMKSDTGVVEEILFLPYYFWGILIIFISIFILTQSLIKLFKS